MNIIENKKEQIESILRNLDDLLIADKSAIEALERFMLGSDYRTVLGLWEESVKRYSKIWCQLCELNHPEPMFEGMDCLDCYKEKEDKK